MAKGGANETEKDLVGFSTTWRNSDKGEGNEGKEEEEHRARPTEVNEKQRKQEEVKKINQRYSTGKQLRVRRQCTGIKTQRKERQTEMQKKV
ncbi:hypothetical protein Pmani_035531 [Petrolisthes manimaculis]|uniref:Uncharacterized protein n=1 Tax=Petrolisthes manimaculis TaxID=1843537 RepID=A0AAE1TND1_9EUCA|nr:hypothetical protein Pmani_035531 [Petrolisthes manimaculis]